MNHKVELEFKRIQTYLFASPRLRAMLGANAALGQTIRVRLPQIAKECGAMADEETLANMPSAVPEDPLQRAYLLTSNDLLADDPAHLYRNYGVLVRDGGHFIATFPEPERARCFIERAIACIAQELPGILIEARLDGERFAHAPSGESLFQHPAFQVSQHLGNLPAESRGAKGTFVSAEEKRMEDRGGHFRSDPYDLIALLESAQLIPCPGVPPQTLEEVAGNDYLALVHADGNSIGKRYQEWRRRSPAPDRSLSAEAHGERFYHSMRVAVRRALTEALEQVFSAEASLRGELLLPESYQLLMLGGDDLLLTCAASYALPFVRAYAEALERIPLCDGKPLSIGAGVAIARRTFPFHRLHATAEALADSAKQRYRAEPALGSVVDWHVTSSAWLDDPIAQRRNDSHAGNAVLSGKPYPVLGARSLDTLLRAAESIGQATTVARSQLRRLVEVMRQGPSLAELSWLELPQAMRETLRDALADFGQTGLFRPLADDLKISVLPDLVELYEIARRSRQDLKERAA
ncbi:MAG: Cas10/Cmr2 second palm domain-containing protein [Rhodocyclaceae bacterium]